MKIAHLLKVGSIFIVATNQYFFHIFLEYGDKFSELYNKKP